MACETCGGSSCHEDCKPTPEQLRKTLNGFCGSQEYHRLTLGPLLATDGVAYLARAAGAFWLVDAIASYQGALKGEPLQVWTLKRVSKRAFALTCTNGNDNKAIVRQEIPFSDFPLDELKLYCTDGVLLLPREY